MYIVIASLTGFDIINFAINLIFSNQAVFPTRAKSQDKNLKELRNCILRIILVWSLFCLMFNTGLCMSTFSTTSFRKLVFHLSVLSIFFVLNQMF